MRLPTFYEQNLIPNWGKFYTMNNCAKKIKYNSVLKTFLMRIMYTMKEKLL